MRLAILGVLICGWLAVAALAQVRINGGEALVTATLNTGLGPGELYQMDQNTRTFDPVEFTGVTSNQNAIGAVSTDGLALENATAAAAGLQQMSPRIKFSGFGWKTTATAASMNTSLIQELLPVQGAAAPSFNFLWRGSIDGSAYSTILTLSSGGVLTTPNTVSAPVIQATTGYYAGTTELIAVGAPAVSTCGDGALQTGSSDSVGRVVGTTQTACTVTFSNALGTNAADCLIGNLIANRGFVSASTTAAFTVTGLTAGDDFMYHCFGR